MAVCVRVKVLPLCCAYTSQHARRLPTTRAIQRMPRIHSHTTYHWHQWSVDTALGRCRGRLLLLHHLHFIVCRHFCDSGPSIRDRDVSCSPVTSFFSTGSDASVAGHCLSSGEKRAHDEAWENKGAGRSGKHTCGVE